MNTFSTVMLIVATMLNFYLIQPLIALDVSSGSMPSHYAAGNMLTGITPKIEIRADEVKKESEKRVIFVGSVVLLRDDTIKFNADKVMVEVNDSGYVSYIKMIGKVWMSKPGLSIKSERAQSDNFSLYIDFLEVTMPSVDGTTDKLRYRFDSGKISRE